MSSTQTVRRLALAMVMATALFAVVGSGVSGAGTSQQKSTGDPVKLMSIINLDPAFGIAIYLPGIQAAVRAANAHGGLKDASGKTHKVEWEVCDARDPNAGEACARKAVDGGYVATISDVNTYGGIQASEILDKAGIPQIGATQIYPEEQKASNQFPLSAGIDGDNIGMVYAAKKAGIKTLHYFQTPGINPRQTRELVDQTIKTVGGLTVVGESTIPFKVADMGPFVQAAKSSGADAIFYAGPPDGLILTWKAMQSLGYTGKLVTIEGTIGEKSLKELGSTPNNTALAGPVPPFTATKQYPAMKQLIADLKAEAKSGNDAAKMDEVSTAATRSWIAFQYLAKVAATVPDVTAASIFKGLNTIKNVDLGLLPVFTPSAVSGIPGFERVAVAAISLTKYKNGKAVLVQKKPIDPLAIFKTGN